METVTLAGTTSGHGINISDSADDGVVVGSVVDGSPAHLSDKIAKGDKILSLSIDAGNLSPEDFQAILKSAAAHPVRLDVKRRSDLSPNAAVHVPRGSLDVDGDVPSPTLQFAADGEVPSTEKDLPGAGASAQVNGDVGGGLMAQLDKMFDVDVDDFKPSVVVNGPHVDADVDDELKIPPANAELNFGAPTISATPDTDDSDTEVVIQAKVPKVQSMPLSADAEFSTPDVEVGTDADFTKPDLEVGTAHMGDDTDVVIQAAVPKIQCMPLSADAEFSTPDVEVGTDADFTKPDVEVGTAHLGDVEMKSDLDVDADKDFHVDTGELTAHLPDVAAPLHGIHAGGDLSTDIKLPAEQMEHPDKDGNIGLAVECQAPTADVTVNAVTPDVDVQKPPLSPTMGYVKVVTPITAHAPKEHDPDTTVDADKDFHVDGGELTAHLPDVAAPLHGVHAGGDFSTDTGIKLPAERGIDVEHPAVERQAPTADVTVSAVTPDVDVQKPPLSPTRGYVKVVTPITAHAPKKHDPDMTVEATVKGKGVKTAHIGDVEMKNDLEVNADKDFHVGGSEVTAHLPDVAAPLHGIDAGGNLSTDSGIKLPAERGIDVEHLDKDGNIGLAVECQAPTADITAVTPDVDVQKPPLSPTLGYVKVVSPITAHAPKELDPVMTVEATVKGKGVKKPKKKSLGAKMKNLFKTDHGKEHPAKVTEKSVQSIEVPPVEITGESPATADVDANLPATGQVSISTDTPSMDIGTGPGLKAQGDVDFPSATGFNEANMSVPGIGGDVHADAEFGRDVDVKIPDETADFNLPSGKLGLGLDFSELEVKSKPTNLQAPVLSGEFNAHDEHAINVSEELPKADFGISKPSIEGRPTVSIEKSQEAFKIEDPSIAMKGNVHLPPMDTEVKTAAVHLPQAHVDEGIPGTRISVEKCQENEQPSVAVEGNADLSMPAPTLEVKPGSPDAQAEGKRKSGLFGGIFGKKDKKKEKEKKVHEPSAEMKLDIQADDRPFKLDIPDISPDVHTDLKQEGILLPTPEDNEQLKIGLKVSKPDVEIKHHGDVDDVNKSLGVTSVKPAVGLRLNSPDVGEPDIDAPEVQMRSQPAIHAEVPELSSTHDDVDLNLNLGDFKTLGDLQQQDGDVGIELKPGDIDLNANKIFDKDAGMTTDFIDGTVSVGAASPQLKMEKPEIPAADAQLTLDADAEIPEASPEHRVHFSDQDTHIEPPAVDVNISAKNGKKKSKSWFPFKKSSKKDKKNAEVESPSANIEISSPFAAVDVPQNAAVSADIDPQLSGDISVAKPAAAATLNADPSFSLDRVEAGVEIPDIQSTLPETEAQASINASVPDVSPDAQVNVNASKPAEEFSIAGLVPSVDTSLDVSADPGKVETNLPGIDLTSPELKFDSSSPEVTVPSVDDAGVHVNVHGPKLDTDGKLEVKPSKVVGDIHGPSVNATADVPQFSADHDKPVADIDVNVSAKNDKDGKKKSKFRLPFMKSSKKDKKNAEVESPTANVEISSPFAEVDVPQNAAVSADIDPQLSGDISVAKPAAVAMLNADPSFSLDGGKAGIEIPDMQSTLPETEAQASINASVPDVSPDAQVNVNANKPVEEFSIAGLVPSVDTSLDIGAGPGKVETNLPGVDLTSPELKFDSSSPEVAVPSVDDAGVHVNVHGPKLDTDGKLEVKPSKVVGDIHCPSVNATADIPQVSADHSKAVPDVDVNVSAKNDKDGKKKSKFRLPFMKSSKKDKKNVEVESPPANVEISSPFAAVDVPQNAAVSADIDPQLSGDISIAKPAAAATLNADPSFSLDGEKAGIEIPDVQSTLPETEAQVSINASVPDVSPDAQVNVNAGKPAEEFSIAGLVPSVDTSLDVSAGPGKVETNLPGIDFTSPELKFDSAAPSVDDAGVHVNVNGPELDTDGKLEVKPSEVVGDIQGPSVNATADVPQFSADHDKPVADIDVNVSAKNGKEGKKKSKTWFPFTSKSKKKADVEAKVEVPSAAVDISGPKIAAVADVDDVGKHDLQAPQLSVASQPVNAEVGLDDVGLHKNADVSADVDLSATKPVAVAVLNADPIVSLDGGKAGIEIPELQSTLPETKPHISVDASAPHVSPEAQLKSPDVYFYSSTPEVDTPVVTGKAKAPDFDVPHVGVHGPEVDTDGKVEVKAGKDTAGIQGPSVNATADIPQLSADSSKAVPDVDVNVSAKNDKDGKKKSKFRFPFAKSSKKDKKTGELDSPPANIEISNPFAAVGVPQNAAVSADIDPQLSGDITVAKPTVTLNAEPAVGLEGEADVNIPEVQSSLPETKAEVSTTVPDVSLKPEVTLDASPPEVKVPMAAGDIKLPDVNGDVDLTTRKDAGDIECPPVDVSADTPQFSAKLASPEVGADVTVQPPAVDVSATADAPSITAKKPTDDHQTHADAKPRKKEKSSLFGKMFGGKSRAKEDVKQPQVDLDVPNTNNINASADIEPQVHGDTLVPIPNASISLDADLDEGKTDVEIPEIESSLPEIQAEAPVSIVLSDVSPDLQVNVSANKPSAEVSAPRLDDEVSVSVPDVIQSDIVPEVQFDQDVRVDSELGADDDDIIVAKSNGPQLHSQPPPPLSPPATDEVAGGCFDLEPNSQVERRVERMDPFQTHGYAILVTSMMLKKGASVHDDLDAVATQMPDDEKDDASSSSNRRSGDSGDRLSGDYGKKNADSMNLNRSLQALAGDPQFVKGDAGTTNTEDDRPLTNGMPDDTPPGIVVNANVKRTTTDDSAVHDASEA